VNPRKRATGDSSDEGAASEEVANLIHPLKPTLVMLFCFALLGETVIAKAMHSIIVEKKRALKFEPDWEEHQRIKKVHTRNFSSWEDEHIVDKLTEKLKKTKDTIKILTELQLTEVARSVDNKRRMMEAQLKKEAQLKRDAEKDCPAASSPESREMEMFEKHEMENGNAPDKKTSSKLIVDCVRMGIFPNTKFVHSDHLHCSEKMAGMTKEEMN